MKINKEDLIKYTINILKENKNFSYQDHMVNGTKINNKNIGHYYYYYSISLTNNFYILFIKDIGSEKKSAVKLGKCNIIMEDDTDRKKFYMQLFLNTIDNNIQLTTEHIDEKDFDLIENVIQELSIETNFLYNDDNDTPLKNEEYEDFITLLKSKMNNMIRKQKIKGILED